MIYQYIYVGTCNMQLYSFCDIYHFFLAFSNFVLYDLMFENRKKTFKIILNCLKTPESTCHSLLQC